MLDIAMPKIEVVESADNYGRFKIEPLDPGYGHTLGNALRRVLLSAIPGSAITRIRIDGVFHDFATIEGMREDITELVLNIKGVRVRSTATEPVTALLSKRGAGPVTAADIDLPPECEVVNPHHYLCTLDTDDARLELELTIERGRGYLAADERPMLPLGEIPVDAMFTPVPRVNYLVENTRIGQATDYDRLLIEVWTDGTLKPGDALGQAVEPEAPPAPNGLTIPADVYDTPIEELDLSTRTYNCLKRADITRVGQVLQMDEKALLSVRNLGQKSMEEIRDKLNERGFIPRPIIVASE
ncbi:MAG: DNA-directed RNA polymerase subunit alpha [Chloroflexaceae bacterium]